MTPHPTGSNLAGILITVGAVVAGLGIWAAIACGWGAPSPEAQRAQATRCLNTIARVEAYRAPGQGAPLGTVLAAALARETRPVHVEGWQPAEAAGDVCMARLRATIGNEYRSFVWYYDPQSGRVEARDDATKRLSGW